MCKDASVCEIDLQDGQSKILNANLMPYNLFLNPAANSIQERVANNEAFKEWCADRVLSIDRRHAKKILNELRLTQNQSIDDKAKISMSYRAVSLQDSFWLKQHDETITWNDVNLFHNHFSQALVPVALYGGSATIRNLRWSDISQELSTNGTYPKAWIQSNNKIFLYKADDSSEDETLRETKASQILSCFDVASLPYFLDVYEGKRVSFCECMTDENRSMVPFRHFKQWCKHHGKNPIDEVKKIDQDGYYKMQIMTYLIGDLDKHDGNWGFFRDNTTGKLKCIHPMFDFNCAFEGYYEKDGGWCIAEEIDIPLGDGEFDFRPTKTQKQVALEGISQVSIHQVHPISRDMFLTEKDFQIFQERCTELGIALSIAEQDI